MPGTRRGNRSKGLWADQGTVQTWVLTPTLDVLQVHWAHQGFFQMHKRWQGQSTATDILCCNSIFPWGAMHFTSVFASLSHTRKSMKREVIKTSPYVLKVGDKRTNKIKPFCLLDLCYSHKTMLNPAPYATKNTDGALFFSLYTTGRLVSMVQWQYLKLFQVEFWGAQFCAFQNFPQWYR